MSPAPAGFHTITPYLVVEDAEELRKRALNARH